MNIKTIPPLKPASKKEIERRRKAFAHILELRAQMPPMKESAVDLIRESRDEMAADG